jgi:hypothetical protein
MFSPGFADTLKYFTFSLSKGRDFSVRHFAQIAKAALVSDEDINDVRRRCTSNVADPSEGRTGYQVEDEICNSRIPKVPSSHRTKDLLTGGVLELQLDVALQRVDDLDHEFDTDRWLRNIVKAITNTSSQETSFVNTGVANNHSLDREVNLLRTDRHDVGTFCGSQWPCIEVSSSFACVTREIHLM